MTILPQQEEWVSLTKSANQNIFLFYLSDTISKLDKYLVLNFSFKWITPSNGRLRYHLQPINSAQKGWKGLICWLNTNPMMLILKITKLMMLTSPLGRTLPVPGLGFCLLIIFLVWTLPVFSHNQILLFYLSFFLIWFHQSGRGIINPRMDNMVAGRRNGGSRGTALTENQLRIIKLPSHPIHYY